MVHYRVVMNSWSIILHVWSKHARMHEWKKNRWLAYADHSFYLRFPLFDLDTAINLFTRLNYSCAFLLLERLEEDSIMRLETSMFYIDSQISELFFYLMTAWSIFYQKPIITRYISSLQLKARTVDLLLLAHHHWVPLQLDCSGIWVSICNLTLLL